MAHHVEAPNASVIDHHRFKRLTWSLIPRKLGKLSMPWADGIHQGAYTFPAVPEEAPGRPGVRLQLNADLSKKDRLGIVGQPVEVLTRSAGDRVHQIRVVLPEGTPLSGLDAHGQLTLPQVWRAGLTSYQGIVPAGGFGLDIQGHDVAGFTFKGDPFNENTRWDSLPRAVCEAALFHTIEPVMKSPAGQLYR